MRRRRQRMGAPSGASHLGVAAQQINRRIAGKQDERIDAMLHSEGGERNFYKWSLWCGGERGGPNILIDPSANV